MWWVFLTRMSLRLRRCTVQKKTLKYSMFTKFFIPFLLPSRSSTENITSQNEFWHPNIARRPYELTKKVFFLEHHCARTRTTKLLIKESWKFEQMWPYLKIWDWDFIFGLAEVRFASFFSGGFITVVVVNPLERNWQKTHLCSEGDSLTGPFHVFFNRSEQNDQSNSILLLLKYVSLTVFLAFQLLS